MDRAVAYAREHRARFVAELLDLIRIPSISTAPERAADVARAARWLADHLAALGFDARVEPTDGHPLVRAEWLRAPGRPTVLCYGHFDVQPPDPLALWTRPPFEPSVEGDVLYARGASDDKGQLFIHLKAAEAILRTAGALPVNVKVLLEGEEEIGSPSLAAYLPRHRRALAADAALVSDGALVAPDLPAITTGLRGLLYVEIAVRGARHDLHSGQFGGVAPNAVAAAAQIVAGLKDRRGRVRIPGFYARVRPPSPAEREAWARLPITEAALLREMGTDAAPGEEGVPPIERLWARPTLDVHGIAGGFTGEGMKTVIPSRASAKVSMRLVPDQRPERILARLVRVVPRLAPPGTSVEVRELASARPVLVPLDAPAVRAAARALEATFGVAPAYVRSGGSIPVVAGFTHILRMPTVLMGFGLPDDNLHAPNEKFALANFHRGIEATIRFFYDLGAGGG
ncbi:MAG: dipeptidase [Armatimonadota bacterium]|nr:dipeptidase [Armatimonadota bacterium]MDR7422398.1 dipeptidase [Armatimonadota bacterium]MDR7454483.1 dipeptidase [Armatimonadota bacterium]MDR7457968.1 dipeptidase [Armatimonadota bacterium]MDR7497055.1 dipeptidase [Armatimonadota bacterium]